MRVIVNGQVREFADAATVTDALRLEWGSESRRGIAVAVEGVIIPRTQWNTTELAPGQRIEILQAVQGG